MKAMYDPRLVHGLAVSRAAEGEKIQIGRGERGREAGVFGWGPQVRVKSRLNRSTSKRVFIRNNINNRIGKIGSVASKDSDFHKTPSKTFIL